MSIIVTVTDNKNIAEDQYPCIMISLTTKLIIMVVKQIHNGETKKLSIILDPGTSGWRVGESSFNFDLGKFDLYTGEIKLKNK